MRWLPWLRPKAAAHRLTASNGGSTLTNPSAWLLSWAGGLTTSAGMSVGPASAMTLAIYYACLRNISEDVGKLPLHTYRRQARGKARAMDHPVYPLLHDAPNPAMTAMTFRETLTHHALAWGNGYAQIIWTPAKEVASLWPIHPSRVQVRRDDDGLLVYDVYGSEITLPGSPTRSVERVRQENMLHLKGLGAEGYSGYSVLRLAAESLGLGLAAQTFGAAFFGNGATVGAVLEHPATLTDAAQRRLRESWQTIYGGPSNAMKLAVLEEGMKYTKLGVPPEEAQFLQTRQFQVEEVCRWFRMPKSKVHDLTDSTYSNMEQQNLEYVPDTLMPWLVRWEQEFKRKLFAHEPDVFAEHAVQGLLRGDQAARASFYKDLFGVGAISPNDVREFENLNSIGPAGDTFFVASNNYTPINQVVMDPAADADESDSPPFPVIPGRNGTNGHHPEEED